MAAERLDQPAAAGPLALYPVGRTDLGNLRGPHGADDTRRARPRHAGAWALSGALAVLVGGLLVLFPVQGIVFLTLILSAFFIASGILKIITVLQNRAPRFPVSG